MTKMNKLFSFLFLSLCVSACSPNEQITENLDNKNLETVQENAGLRSNNETLPFKVARNEIDPGLLILSKSFHSFIDEKFEEITDGPLLVTLNDIVTQIFKSTNYDEKLSIRFYESEIDRIVITNDNTIFVFSGVIPIAENPVGLTKLIAHEFGHFSSGHFLENFKIASEGKKVSDFSKTELEELAQSVYLQGKSPEIKGNFPIVKYSKDQESEAKEVEERLLQHLCVNNPSSHQELCDETKAEGEVKKIIVLQLMQHVCDEYNDVPEDLCDKSGAENNPEELELQLIEYLCAHNPSTPRGFCENQP